MFVQSLLTGADSFVVAAAVAPVVHRRSSRITLIILFGLFDAAGSILSTIAEIPVPRLALMPPIAVAGYGLFLLIVVRRMEHIQVGWPAFFLPMILSLDNWIVGIPAGESRAVQASQVFGVGCISAILAAAGIGFGIFLTKGRSAKQGASLAGALLIAVAAILAIG